MMVMNRLFLFGDSTCAAKSDSARPETGWGESFSAYLSDGWTVDNRAKNGLSSRSAILSGIFSSALLEAEAGDAAIIQFGHNDSKPDEERHADPWTGYIADLVYMASLLKKKGVAVYFATSIARRRFRNGIIIDTHGDYPAAMKAAGYQAGVPVIDLTVPLMVELQRLGEEESLKYFMNFPGGIYGNYPDGKEDNTHLRPAGAAWVASLVAEKLSELDPVPVFLKSGKTCSESLSAISLMDEGINP